MAFKQFDKNMSFADLELAGILEKTRTQGYLGEINQVIMRSNFDGLGAFTPCNIKTDIITRGERNKGISKIRYKIGQYFGLSERHMGGGRARFTTLIKEHCFLPVAKRKGTGSAG